MSRDPNRGMATWHARNKGVVPSLRPRSTPWVTTQKPICCTIPKTKYRRIFWHRRTVMSPPGYVTRSSFSASQRPAIIVFMEISVIVDARLQHSVGE